MAGNRKDFKPLDDIFIYSFPKIELGTKFSTKISAKSRVQDWSKPMWRKISIKFQNWQMEQQKNPRPLKKISPSEEEEFVFEPFKFYAPVNVPARKSRIFCFRGVFTPRGDEGGVDRTASARANFKIPFPRILLSCCSSSMRARTDHCKRRYRMNGIAIPFAEATANLSTNLIVGRITDQCRYLWWNCSRIRGGFRRWRGEEIGKKLMEGWFRSRGNPEFHASRGLMTIRRDAREVDGDAASPPPSLFHHCDITRR